MTRNTLRVLCFVLSICVYVAGPNAYAQSDPINSELISDYGLRNLENAVTIHASPSIPSAGDTVHFSVEAPIYDLTKDSITWTINGKTAKSGVGAATTDVTIDAKGSPLNVAVSVSDPVWGLASNALTLVPLQLDILYDAPTYVPPFYRGRALPSAGGVVRLQAIARFTENGKLIPSSGIRYTWSRNGTVLGNLSGLGKSEISIDTTTLYGANTISLKATALNDTLSAAGSVVIPDTPVALMLYEDHPLFGITYFNALPKQVAAASEMTVSAVPYFATVARLSDPALQYNILLNDSKVAASSTKRNEVTISADKDIASLRVEVTSLQNFFMSAVADWKFIFGTSGGSSVVQPGASDAFHNSQL